MASLIETYADLVNQPGFAQNPAAQRRAADLRAQALPLYQQIVSSPRFGSNPQAQGVAHQMRASGLVKDPTQGGLISPAAVAQSANATLGRALGPSPSINALPGLGGGPSLFAAPRVNKPLPGTPPPTLASRMAANASGGAPGQGALGQGATRPNSGRTQIDAPVYASHTPMPSIAPGRPNAGQAWLNAPVYASHTPMPPIAPGPAVVLHGPPPVPSHKPLYQTPPVGVRSTSPPVQNNDLFGDFNRATGTFFDRTLPQAAQSTAQGLGDLLTFYNPADLAATRIRQNAQKQGIKLPGWYDKMLSLPSNADHDLANVAVGIPMSGIQTAQAVGADIAGAVTQDPAKKKAANDYADKIVKGMVGGMVGVPDLDPNSEEARHGWFVNAVQGSVALRNGDLAGAGSHSKKVLTSLANGFVDHPVQSTLAILPFVHLGGVAVDSTVVSMGRRVEGLQKVGAEAYAKGDVAGYQKAMGQAKQWSDARTMLQNATSPSHIQKQVATGAKQAGAALGTGARRVGDTLQAGLQGTVNALTPPAGMFGPQLAPAGGPIGSNLYDYTNRFKPQPTMFSNVLPTPGPNPGLPPVSSLHTVGQYNRGNVLDLPTLGGEHVVDNPNFGGNVRIISRNTGQPRNFSPKVLDFLVRRPGEQHLSLDDFLKQRLGDLHDYAMDKTAPQLFFPMLPVDPAKIADYKSNTTFDLTDYMHYFDAERFQHILNGHGPNSVDGLKLTRDNFQMIKNMINAQPPLSVGKAPLTQQQQAMVNRAIQAGGPIPTFPPAIQYTYPVTVNGRPKTLVYIEELQIVNKGKTKRLAPQTMFIQ